MPVVRALPRSGAGSNQLLALYHDRLTGHWPWRRRLVAKSLSIAGLGTGWSEMERRLLPDDVRAAGLSMADRRGIHRLLNPAGLPLKSNILRNKALFARHAHDHALPVPVDFDPEADHLDAWLTARERIITKPGYSSKGRGIAAFAQDGDGWNGPDGRLTQAALKRHINVVIGRHGVVQEQVARHEALADISPDALPTLRIVSCRDERGVPEVCATILRLGAGNGRPVDNFNAGGIAVRLEAGRCTDAFQASGDRAQYLHRHPLTGAAILGRHVPDLEVANAFALRSHDTLPEGFTVVGWDIGLSRTGPVVVEGNWNPGTDIIQLVGGTGLDETRLGSLYRFHLARIPAEGWRTARAIEW